MRILLPAVLLALWATGPVAAYAASAKSTKPKPSPPKSNPPLKSKSPTKPKPQLKDWPIPDISPEEALRSVGGPALITLDMTQAHPRDVFAALAQQSGLPLVPVRDDPNLWNQNWPQVTLQAKAEPFWSVIQRLSKQTSFMFQKRFALPSTIEIARFQEEKPGFRPWISGFSQDASPFWVVASYANGDYGTKLNWGANPTPQQHIYQSATFLLYPDPHILPLIVPNSAQGWFDEATDESGRSVLSALAQPKDISSIGTITWISSLFWEAKTPSKSLKRVHGKVATLLALNRTSWEIPIALSPQGQASAIAEKTFDTAQGPLTYHLELTQTGDTYDMVISWQADKGAKLPSYRIWQLLDDQNLQVVGQNGSSLRPLGQGGDANKAVYSFQQINPLDQNMVGVPTKIVLKVPTDVRRLTVPFEFHDLPLPTP